MNTVFPIDGGSATLVLLDSREAWESIRSRAAAFGSGVEAGNPWSMWEYFSTLCDCFLSDKTNWYLEVTGAGEASPGGCMFLTEEVQKRRMFSLKVLRALDHMAFRLPPFLCAQGAAEKVSSLLAAALRAAGRHLKADLFIQYRLEENRIDRWVSDLTEQGCSVRKRLFTTSPKLEPGEDFEEFCKGKRNVLPDIRRRERRMNTENPGSVTMKHLWRVCPDRDAGAEAWKLFQACRDASWQKKWIEDSGRADISAVDRFYRTMAEIWGERGWTSLQTLEIGGTPAAAQFWLMMPGSTWLIIFAYDQQFSRHGVGNVLMFRSLEDWHAHGGRLIEFGGECLGWKKDWANGFSDIFQLEVGLGSLKARLWALAGRIRPKPEREMVRTGRENDLGTASE
ncbi:MAG: GNAT family N-acetyltransferase [Rectinemataceae bacterium]|nr:GNAT family N-acetyltransferase [Rectinemataceae bacterium]